MKRKWLRLAALGMAVVLTGCQNSSPATGADSAATDNETKTESGAASGAQETGGNGNFNPEGLPIVKEKETFTIVSLTRIHYSHLPLLFVRFKVV